MLFCQNVRNFANEKRNHFVKPNEQSQACLSYAMARNGRIYSNVGKDMANKDYSIRQEHLARFAKAMGHPARITILQFLAKRNTCYFGDIHEELPIAKATVSQHLKELKDAGLIQGEVEAPKVRYCINRDNWQLAKELFGGFFRQCLCEKETCC